jgi:hypothetical protein
VGFSQPTTNDFVYSGHQGHDQEPQAWLDSYRSEYNQVRPREALAMRDAAELWSESPRRYNPNPPPWEYPEDAWTLKVACQGTVDLRGQRWRIGQDAGRRTGQIQPVEDRFLVFFCSTLVREIDPATRRATIVEQRIEEQKTSQ